MLFMICLQSIFSVVEIIIELFVVCQKLIHVALCIILFLLLHKEILK